MWPSLNFLDQECAVLPWVSFLSLLILMRLQKQIIQSSVFPSIAFPHIPALHRGFQPPALGVDGLGVNMTLLFIFIV